MLHNIDLETLAALKDRDPEAAQIIDTMLENHQQIVSSISHEIRNPLTLVYSSLQLIASKYPESQGFKFWDTTIETVEFMKLLLEELSSFNNGETLNCVEINTSLFLRKISLSYALALEKNPIEISSNISNQLPPIIGDKIKLREVLLNLLRNAQDAVSSNGKIMIAAQVDESTNQMIITVEDNGYGMDPCQLEDIFEMFKTYKSDGTGLGLPISRRIIEAHGGTLTAESEFGKGSIFTIRLPIAPTIEQDCQEKATH